MPHIWLPRRPLRQVKRDRSDERLDDEKKRRTTGRHIRGRNVCAIATILVNLNRNGVSNSPATEQPSIWQIIFCSKFNGGKDRKYQEKNNKRKIH